MSKENTKMNALNIELNVISSDIRLMKVCTNCAFDTCGNLSGWCHRLSLLSDGQKELLVVYSVV